MRKIISLLLTVSLLLVCLSSCSGKITEGYFHRTQRNEYGRLSVSISKASKDSSSLSEEELKAIYDGACDAFEKAYLPLSESCGVSGTAEAVSTVLDLDSSVTDHIKAAIKLSEETGGLYQPCGGSLTALLSGEDELTDEKLTEALSHVGCDKITVKKTSVTKSDPLTVVDLYSYADAYALSCAVDFLEKSDALYGTVSFNGIAGVFGEKPDGESFVIDVSDGTDTGKEGCFTVTDGYVALAREGFGYHCDFIDGKADDSLEWVTVCSSDPVTAAVVASVGLSYGADAVTELYKSKSFTFEAVLTAKDGTVTYTDSSKEGSLYTPLTSTENEK